MGRAAQARRIAAAAAFGGTGLTALGAAGFGVLVAEARLARRWIGTPFGQDGPDASGVYGHGPGEPLEIAMLGDSSAVGLGADHPSQTPGAVIAMGLAAMTGRPVRLRVFAVVGAQTANLEHQIARLTGSADAGGRAGAGVWAGAAEAEVARTAAPRTEIAGVRGGPGLSGEGLGAPDEPPARPHLAVIMVGANDVTHRVRPAVSVRYLDSAVRALRELGAEVVVGTCPDLGTIEPLAQPLRSLAKHLSRQLAAAQTIAVVEAGGRTVSLGGLLGPEFYARPNEMFSADRFHPSAAGYARAASALLSSCAAALEVWPAGFEQPPPDLRVGEGVDDVAHAAARAASAAGTEVSGAEVSGAERGPRGRWAVLLRRRPTPAVAPRDDVVPDDEVDATREADSGAEESRAAEAGDNTRGVGHQQAAPGEPGAAPSSGPVRPGQGRSAPPAELRSATLSP